MSRKVTFLSLMILIALWLILLDVSITDAQASIKGVEVTPALTTNSTSMLLDPLTLERLQQRRSVLPALDPAGAPVRGVLNDLWADVVIGQPNFGQITPNEVVANKLFNPGGVYVDRSTIPNRVYVYDAGNSRILGLSSLGACSAGVKAGQACTSNSDCPGSTCTINSSKPADIILGQPSPNSSACNGDSGFQTYPDFLPPTASTLCGLRPDSISILEGGSMATMATDAQGNLYHPDYLNNRVLRYNNPLNSDAAADHVWGQTDFTHGECNEGRSYGSPDNNSLCLIAPLRVGSTKSGVAIDSSGNLWVADTQNHRVLRFPYSAATGAPAETANLVLGQASFTTAISGPGLNEMNNPGSVRVDASGKVYVLDGMDGWAAHGRLLVFVSPLSNGMAASQVFDGLGEPTGLELDPDGVLWVNNTDKRKILRLFNGQLQTAITNVDGLYGGIGIDRDRNLLITGWDSQQVLIYSAPDYAWTSTALQADEYGFFNKLGPRGVTDTGGLEVTDSQLIVSDQTRLLFWNDPAVLTSNYPPASGVIGQPDFFTRPRWGMRYGRMRADTHGRLWVLWGDVNQGTRILAYQLPLGSQAQPIMEIASPLPLRGGGSFSWSGLTHLGGIAYQPDCDCLWVSDPTYSRVFRIRNVSSSSRTVDIVLGQTSAEGVHCNQGRDPDTGGAQFPTRDSLCHPGGMAFDWRGNLFVSDHNLEFEGNWRMLEYDAATLPLNPSAAVFGLPASRVYGRNGSFTEPDCQWDDPMCGPWEPVFYPNNDMVIGFNTYLGPPFPQIYHDPLTNPLPYTALGDFYSHAYSARLDSLNNLYVLDGTRNHVLIYRSQEQEFADVPPTYWAWNFIERLFNASITGGCALNPPRYCPEESVTRAQMAVFLLRGIHTSAYAPPGIGGGTGFADVPPSYWSASWIKQLAAEGITTGCGGGYFCPDHAVTRAQMAVFLLRSKYGASYVPPDVGAGTGFGDVPPNYWAAAWIKQLVTEGITSGCGGGNYCPENPVTRAQMAVFLVRTFNLP